MVPNRKRREDEDEDEEDEEEEEEKEEKEEGGFKWKTLSSRSLWCEPPFNIPREPSRLPVRSVSDAICCVVMTARDIGNYQNEARTPGFNKCSVMQQKRGARYDRSEGFSLRFFTNLNSSM